MFFQLVSSLPTLFSSFFKTFSFSFSPVSFHSSFWNNFFLDSPQFCNFDPKLSPFPPYLLVFVNKIYWRLNLLLWFVSDSYFSFTIREWFLERLDIFLQFYCSHLDFFFSFLIFINNVCHCDKRFSIIFLYIFTDFTK